jgi:TRAP-type C4-dicarboxylate transport system permease small subunit
MSIEKISAAINRISRWAAYLASLLGGLLVLLILAEIARRTFWGSSFLWAFEMSSWLLVGFIFLGMAYTLQTGGHVRVQLLTDRLSRRTREYLELIQALFGAGLFAFLSVYVFKGAVSNFETGARGLSELDPPLYIIWGVAFLGLSLFALQFIGIFLDRLNGIRSRETKGHE